MDVAGEGRYKHAGPRKEVKGRCEKSQKGSFMIGMGRVFWVVYLGELCRKRGKRLGLYEKLSSVESGDGLGMALLVE